MRVQDLPTQRNQDPLKIVIVADTASARFGGESILPLHYFRVLRNRGHAVWLVTHARTRAELDGLFPGEQRVRYAEDSALHRAMHRLGRRLPNKLAYHTTALVVRASSQFVQRRIVRDLVRREGIDIVHQPTPVSPLEPSMIHGVGAPVIVGPMNGGMRYPPAFRGRDGAFGGVLLRFGRVVAPMLNRLLPGKRRAALLIVANERTRAVLPVDADARIEELVENGVDLELWTPPRGARPAGPSVTRFAFVGRLVPLKAVDLLLEAFFRVSGDAPMELIMIGDGAERPALERLAAELAQRHGAAAVRFVGWITQEECATRLSDVDCLVMPSLHDCGGAVVLEAMAMSKPVVAVAWGGPFDYLDASCGILVPPQGRDALVDGFAAAMLRLARSPHEREAMGRAGRARVEREFDWEVKAERILGLYRRCVAAAAAERVHGIGTA